MLAMTHNVPDWDNTRHSGTSFEYVNLCNVEKAEAHQHQFGAMEPLQYLQHHPPLRGKKLESALVPTRDVLDTLRLSGMQGDAAHSTDGPECPSIPALDGPLRLSNLNVHEDEMLSWLQYPHEDSFDKNYCSEMFGQLMNPHVQLVKDGFLHQTMKEGSTRASNIDSNMDCDQMGFQKPTQKGSTSYPARPGIESDAAMVLGAGRASGLLSQTGSEVFNCVRTHVNPCGLPKSFSSASMESLLDGKRASQTVDPVATAVPSRCSAFNFSLFSRPLATTQESLRLIGGASGPINVERARLPLAKDLLLSYDTNLNGDLVQSTSATIQSSQQSAEFSYERRGARHGAVSQGLHSPASLPCRSVVRADGDALELNSHVTCASVSEDVIGTGETAETTVSLCLSGSSSEKIVQQALTPSPKKFSSSAKYSEDVEDVAVNAKKPPPGPRSTSKRSRVAETHNESEKKRRNKINVRLKVLQSLIPNSNKTDKASVLDEAIEYTKMLQAQVQFMSMKTGMFFPAMMSSGMHYLPMQQMPTFPHLAMQMGMGMGVDMGGGMHLAHLNVAMPVGVGAGVIAGTGAVHQPLHVAYPGPQVLQTVLPSPNHVVSGCLPLAVTSEPYKVMSQELIQPELLNVQRDADVSCASLQQMMPTQEKHMTNSFS